MMNTREGPPALVPLVRDERIAREQERAAPEAGKE